MDYKGLQFVNETNQHNQTAKLLYDEIIKHMASSDEERIFYIEKDGFKVCCNKITGDCIIESESINLHLNINEQNLDKIGCGCE